MPDVLALAARMRSGEVETSPHALYDAADGEYGSEKRGESYRHAAIHAGFVGPPMQEGPFRAYVVCPVCDVELGEVGRMGEPTTYEEYQRLFAERTVIEGYGMDLAARQPCPFCAAPNFIIMYPVAGAVPGDDRPTLDEQMRAETTCGSCGRSGKHVVHRTAFGVRAEFVQTGGADPPAWLAEVMPVRRVS